MFGWLGIAVFMLALLGQSAPPPGLDLIRATADVVAVYVRQLPAGIPVRLRLMNNEMLTGTLVGVRGDRVIVHLRSYPAPLEIDAAAIYSVEGRGGRVVRPTIR